MNQSKKQIRLKRRDGSWYEQTIEHFSGAVQINGLVVLAGQTIFVEADLSGDQLHNFRELDQPENPGKTITVEFKQMDDGGMMLSLTQPFNRDVKFDLEILRLEGDHFAPTSSLPVRAGTGGLHEMWPDPISMVVLKNARFVDSDAASAVHLEESKSKNVLFEKVESTGRLSWLWWTIMALIFMSILGKIFLRK